MRTPATLRCLASKVKPDQTDIRHKTIWTWLARLSFTVRTGNRGGNLNSSQLELELEVEVYPSPSRARAGRALMSALAGHVPSQAWAYYYFFWTHFILSLWTAMHLRMRRAAPSVDLDVCEGRVEHDRAKRLPRRLQLE